MNRVKTIEIKVNSENCIFFDYDYNSRSIKGVEDNLNELDEFKSSKEGVLKPMWAKRENQK